MLSASHASTLTRCAGYPMIGRPDIFHSHSAVTIPETMRRFSLPQVVLFANPGAVCAGLAVIAFFATQTNAQGTQPNKKKTVQAASFGQATPAMPQAVRFSRRPPQVGDQSEQTVTFEMRLATTLRQGREIVEKKEKTMRTSQRRSVITTEIDSGRTTAVEVRYLEAVAQVMGKPTANSAGAIVPAESKVVQPVNGKTYQCRREASADGQDVGELIITDELGQIPPQDEFEFVAESMDAIGRPNPLAEFLAGRTIQIGEKITLPKEVAERLFGMGDQIGQVTQFDLTLQRTQSENGMPYALFLASVEAAAHGSSQMGLQVEGPMVVQLDTCRVIRTELSGPIGMSETRGSHSTMHQLIGMGQLKMRVATLFHDAHR